MKDKGRILKLGIIFAILISILGIFVLVNADNTKSYVVDVVDPKGREEDCADNDEIEIKKSILKDQEEEPYYDEKELTYQVEVSNILEKKDLEIALVIDTSYSMETNDQEELMKQKAKELVKEIYESNSGVEIQLFSASSTSKTEMLSADWEEDLTTAIDSLILGDGSNIVDGLNAAQNSFTAEDNKDRYIILFTDATDKATESLARAYTNDIKIISVLINNIVSNKIIIEVKYLLNNILLLL